MDKEKCRGCEGKGYLIIGQNIIKRCPKCFGRRKLDWIEAVVGPRRDIGMPNLEQLICWYKEDNGGELKFIKNGKRIDVGATQEHECEY